ncbi:MAG: permease, partial [Acidimicrobiia bacterium]|nr:permease [Acidimicrobiia bacterium]
LGGDSPLAVPLAALLGLPAYINTEGSLPLVATMVDGGMGPGPALAFIVTGAGTSIGAISGLFVIARTRIVALVVAMLFVGAVALGWSGQVIL